WAFGKRLAQVGAERDILPGLDVAGRPVVEEHGTEEVLLGVVGGDLAAHRRSGADDEPELRLDVEADRGPEDRRRVLGALALTLGPDDVGAGDHDRGGASVVAD